MVISANASFGCGSNYLADGLLAFVMPSIFLESLHKQ